MQHEFITHSVELLPIFEAETTSMLQNIHKLILIKSGCFRELWKQAKDSECTLD